MPCTFTIERYSTRVAGNRRGFLSGVLPRVRWVDDLLVPGFGELSGPCHDIVCQFVVRLRPQSAMQT